jgi:hypothetical protein
MERRKFIESMGRCCAGTGFCLSLTGSVFADEPDKKKKVPGHSCEEKMTFFDGWIKNIMRALDDSTDDLTRCRIMEANGKACARDYLKSLGQEPAPVRFEDWIARIKKQDGDGSVKVEGNTIYFQYLKNYQGLDAPEAFCLCPLVESKPAGLSATYCHCSVGYIQEIFSRKFGQPVKVDLLDSVLRGGKRCKFKIELAG